MSEKKNTDNVFLTKKDDNQSQTYSSRIIAVVDHYIIKWQPDYYVANMYVSIV